LDLIATVDGGNEVVEAVDASVRVGAAEMQAYNTWLSLWPNFSTRRSRLDTALSHLVR
jgi:hypothetical protein